MESHPIPANHRINLTIGVLLVVLGILALIENIIPSLGETFWIAALAIGGLVMSSLYLTDRTQWWALIPAYILFFVAALIFVATRSILQDEAIASFIMFAFALPFVFVGVLARSNWWAFIPAYVFGALGTMLLLVDRILQGEQIAAFIMFAFALPFLMVAVLNRRNWWGLIPAYVFAAIGVMLAFVVNRGNDGMIVPAYVNFAVALPFLLVFLRNPRNWWALIPGGIMASIGLGFLIGAGSVQVIVPAALILGGLFLIGRQLVRRPAEPALSPSARDVAPEPVSGREADRSRG